MSFCQSAAILEYLADVTGQFGGADLDERLQAREWLYWDFDRLAPPVYRSRLIRLGFREAGSAVIEMYGADGRAALKVLDGHLAGRSWLVGEGPTIADDDAFGVLVFASEAGFDLDAFGSVRAWMERFQALPGFAKPQSLLPQASRTAL
jgi:glutathione S-transferase